MNPTEAQIIALQVQAMAVQAEITACLAHDRHKEAVGESTFYLEEVYINLSNELYKISNEIHVLAKSGGLS